MDFFAVNITINIKRIKRKCHIEYQGKHNNSIICQNYDVNVFFCNKTFVWL